MQISMTPSLYLTAQSQDKGQNSKHPWTHSTGHVKAQVAWPEDVLCCLGGRGLDPEEICSHTTDSC